MNISAHNALADPRATTVCSQASWGFPCICPLWHLGQDHQGPWLGGRPGWARQDDPVHLDLLPWKPDPAHWDLQVLPENQRHLVRHAYTVSLDHLVRLPWKPGPAHWDLQVLPENQRHLVRHAYT